MGQELETRLVCLTELTDKNRQELVQRLHKITGWVDLEFDKSGRLRKGTRPPTGGSATARSLLTKAMAGPKTIVIEEASRDPNVVFSRVLSARWKDKDSNVPEVSVIQIDFADFQFVTGDRMALEAFDVGWVMLHELDHIVNDSLDAYRGDETGECEDHINRMRRECDLPERGAYFFTPLPTASDSAFAARFVRLAFEKGLDGARRKYWLVWDANLVGGLPPGPLASLR